jgi:hypothetical protein
MKIVEKCKGGKLAWDEHDFGSDTGLTANRVGLVDGANLLRSWATKPVTWAPDGPRGRGKRAGRLSQAGVQGVSAHGH